MEYLTMENYKPKIGYKGFDANLQCRKKQFKVGGTFFKQTDKQNPVMCSKDGYHYCNNLLDVFIHYSRGNGNRFCEIEILGNFTDDKGEGKSITTAFKILRELPKDEIDKIIEVNQKIRDEERFKESLNIPLLKTLQTKYPHMIVGGSVGLFLHGISLKRLKHGVSDVDIIMPYFTLIEEDENIDIEESEVERESGADFETVLLINGIKFDISINPNNKYEFIEYDGFKFKVNILETIMEAKWRYAIKGSKKHKDDCYEICGKVKNKTIKTNSEIKLPF